MNFLNNKKKKKHLVQRVIGVALNWAIADDYVIAAVEIYKW